METNQVYTKVVAAAGRHKRVTSVLVYGSVTLLPQLTSGILAILYTRVFSPGEYGNYGIFAAVMAFMSIVTDFGLPAATLRNYYDGKNQSVAYLSSVIYGARFLMFGTALLIGVPLYLFWDQLGVRFPQAWLFVPALITIAFVDRSGEILATICRAIERPGYYAAGRLAQSIAMILAGIVLVFIFRLGIGGALLSVLAGKLAALLIYEFVVMRKLEIPRGRFSWPTMRASIAFGLPLVPNRLAGWGRQLALRPTLAHVVPLPQVGLFSFASSVAAIPNLLSTAIDLALAPIYFRRREGGDAEEFGTKMVSFATIFLAITFPVWVTAIVFCPEIIRLLAGVSYQGAAPVCAVLFCANFASMQASFLQRQIHFLRQTWLLSAVTIPFSILAVVLTIVFAGQVGILAAGLTALAADAGILITLAAATHYYEDVDYPIFTALLFLTELSALAIWVGLGAPGPSGWPNVVLKVIFVGIAALLSLTIWIWPNRQFLREIVAG